MLRVLRHAIVAMLAALVLTGTAQAGGGDYVFEGGGAKARGQVRAALNASSFDWGLVPVQVTIHIRRGVPPHSTVGEIWLDPRLLASGRFAWGIVQHEYAHQVAFFLFGARDRAHLTRVLGGKDWCYENPSLDHHEHACERFASTLAWAYWPSRHNSERPESRRSESAAMRPARFRALLARMLDAGAR